LGSLHTADKQSIHTVSIDKNIFVPQNMYYMGANARGTLAIPLAGPSVALAVGAREAPAIQKFIKANGIRLDQIVRNQFIQQINQKTNLKVIDKGHADAQLVIMITGYGLSIPNGFHSELVPILGIKATLTRNGQIVWIGQDYNSVLASGLLRYTWQQIQQNPQLLHQMWDSDAEKIIGRIVATL
jgi:hypothetical protein